MSAFALPRGACDCHCHVFGPAARFPYAEPRSYTPDDAPLETYIALLDRLGFAYEGILPHGATVSGHPVDVLTHRLERESWRQSENSIEMPASGYPA